MWPIAMVCSWTPLIVRLTALSLSPPEYVCLWLGFGFFSTRLHGLSRMLKMRQSTAHCRAREHMEMVFNANGGLCWSVSGRFLHLVIPFEQMEGDWKILLTEVTMVHKRRSPHCEIDERINKQVS